MLRERVERVHELIAAAARRSGRDPDDVRMLAVTKTQDRETVMAALEAGLSLFGENRVQEAVTKYASLQNSAELHLIGHLQRNKAKYVPGLFSWVESVDREEVAHALNERWPQEMAPCQILLQYNSSGEDSKFGYHDVSELLDVIGTLDELPRVTVRGVMTIGPFTDDVARLRRAFSETNTLFQAARAAYPEKQIDTLSMGMSNDYEIAVEEGATEVRLGSVLFGKRVS